MESIQSTSARDVQIKELINDFLKKAIARGTLTASDYYVSHMSEFDKHSINISDWYNAVGSAYAASQARQMGVKISYCGLPIEPVSSCGVVAIVITSITAQARRRSYYNRPKA